MDQLTNNFILFVQSFFFPYMHLLFEIWVVYYISHHKLIIINYFLSLTMDFLAVSLALELWSIKGYALCGEDKEGVQVKRFPSWYNLEMKCFFFIVYSLSVWSWLIICKRVWCSIGGKLIIQVVKAQQS